MSKNVPTAPMRGLSGATKGMRFMNRSGSSPTNQTQKEAKKPSPSVLAPPPQATPSNCPYTTAAPVDLYGREVIETVGRRSFLGCNRAIEDRVKTAWGNIKSDKRVRKEIDDEEMLRRYKEYVGVKNVAGGGTNKKRKKN